MRQAVYERRLKGNAVAAARKSASKSDQATGGEALARVGKAMGVDLGGVLATE